MGERRPTVGACRGVQPGPSGGVGESAAGNEALWLLSPGGPFDVRPAPEPVPGPGEVVVRVRAVALNPVDAIGGLLRRAVTPWVRYPTVLGSDVAGDVTAVGRGVVGLQVGDRVVGFAAGGEKQRNSAAEGGFQHHAVLLERVTATIPETMSYERAAVLPLGLATAAAGLFEPDQLGLPVPTPTTSPASRSEEVVLVWGASTSVGCSAVQLARAAGFSVVATAGSRNHDLVRSLGADTVFDYRATDVDGSVVDALRGRQLVGTVAIGRGSLTHAIHITTRAPGSRRIASVYPDPLTRTRALLAKVRGLYVSSIWGGTPVGSAVGPAVFNAYLPGALANGTFRPAPEALVVGEDLQSIPDGLARLRQGVSATKLVVRLGHVEAPRP